MSREVVFEDAPLREFSRTLERATPRVAQEVRATMARAGLELKRRLQSEATGSPSFKGVRASISYDLFNGVDNVGVDVGPEIGRAQGSLAFIAYEGSATSGPVFPEPQQALDDEAKVLEEHLAAAAEKL